MFDNLFFIQTSFTPFRIRPEYIGKIDNGYLVPGKLGMGLVEGYESIDLPLAEPKLRAGLEQDLKRICVGERDAQEVLSEQIRIYRDAFKIITEKARLLDQSMAIRLEAGPVNSDIADQPMAYAGADTVNVFKCPKCGGQNAINLKFINDSYVLSCSGFPDCRNSYWLPSNVVRKVTVLDADCPNCGPGYKKLQFDMKSVRHVCLLNPRYVSEDGLSYCSCIVCDRSLQELCDISINRCSVPSSAPPPPPPHGRMQIETSTNSNRRPPAPPPPPAAIRATTTRPAAPPRPAPQRTVPAPRPRSNVAPPPSNNSSSAEVRCSACNKLARRFVFFFTSLSLFLN